jgi:hypothetical protein
MLLSFFLISIFTFISCERYPVSALTSIPSSISSWPTTWYLYDDEINTKGSYEPKVWDNSRFLELKNGSLSFKSTGAYQGRYCIKMEWYDASQNIVLPSGCFPYAGWALASTDPADIGSKNMTTSGYTRLEFEAKGSLSAGCIVKVEIPRHDGALDTDNILLYDGGPNRLTSVWKTFSIPITSRTTSNWGIQQYYVAIAMKRDSDSVSTNGGTIYIDNIRFVKD